VVLWLHTLHDEKLEKKSVGSRGVDAVWTKECEKKKKKKKRKERKKKKKKKKPEAERDEGGGREDRKRERKRDQASLQEATRITALNPY